MVHQTGEWVAPQRHTCPPQESAALTKTKHRSLGLLGMTPYSPAHVNTILRRPFRIKSGLPLIKSTTPGKAHLLCWMLEQWTPRGGAQRSCLPAPGSPAARNPQGSSLSCRPDLPASAFRSCQAPNHTDPQSSHLVSLGLCAKDTGPPRPLSGPLLSQVLHFAQVKAAVPPADCKLLKGRTFACFFCALRREHLSPCRARPPERATTQDSGLVG